MVAGENPPPGNSLPIETPTPPPTSRDHSRCPRCDSARRHIEDAYDCRVISELRELGKSIGWARVPIAYGRAIQATEPLCQRFLDTTSTGDLVGGIRQAKFWRFEMKIGARA